MPIQLKEEAGWQLVICVSGVLTKEDYDRLLPELEPMLRRHGHWRILFEMTDFHGWEPAALWEELKFDWAHFRHYSDIERCAVVGDRKWQSMMATLSKPFTGVAIRYFDHTDLAGARVWLNESAHVAGLPDDISRQESIMTVQINTDHNIEGHEALAARVTGVVESALSSVSDHITRVEVHLSNENSDKKNGQHDMRCMMEARLEGRQPIAVTNEAATLDQAVDGAADKLTRLIESTLGRARDEARYRTAPAPIASKQTIHGRE